MHSEPGAGVAFTVLYLYNTATRNHSHGANVNVRILPITS